MPSRISLHEVMDLVAREKGWRDTLLYTSFDKSAADVLTYDEFERILIMESVTTNPRKVRELWNYLKKFGIGRQVNQNDRIVVNMVALRDLLAKEYPIYRDAPGLISVGNQTPSSAHAHAHTQNACETLAETEDSI